MQSGHQAELGEVFDLVEANMPGLHLPWLLERRPAAALAGSVNAGQLLSHAGVVTHGGRQRQLELERFGDRVMLVLRLD
ncbi:MAG: hypothetical protein JOZ65_21550 [Chloroflexi bacterium]|nr:hypothetical protein [Chloroflexota bacterium]